MTITMEIVQLYTIRSETDEGHRFDFDMILVGPPPHPVRTFLPAI